MLENLRNFFKKMTKKDEEELLPSSGDAAKERLHLVLMQDRANVSVDFLDLMKQEIIDVIKKYIDIDENEMDVRLTNQINEDGTNGAPALYANIPIIAIKNEKKKEIEQKIKEDNLIKENELVNACNDYIDYDKDFTFEGTEKYITMDTLVSKNYMSKIIDTSSGNECKAFAKVTKNKVNGYDVEACLICDEYVSENSFCTRDAYNDL